MGRNIIQNMEIIKKILVVGLLVSSMTACKQTNVSDNIFLSEIDDVENACETFGVILPHHLLVEQYIAEVYGSLSDCGFERVIVVSPNHFNYGARYIQSSDKGVLSEMDNLDVENILMLKRSSPLSIEPRYFSLEHGISVQLEFLNQYLPEAKVIPIIIKKGTPVNQLELLVGAIMSLDLSNTLVVASIDFTHFEGEDAALINDSNTVTWMQEFSENKGSENMYEELLNLVKALDETNEEAVAFDSVESLYVFLSLMSRTENFNFGFLRRTSSASMLGLTDPLDNTSHIFAKFSK
ncbi:AmmeMemoRadiSam system protein B [Candidatus Peregrinibacteria bacterium]|nr:AmmeMemoRadiSam system protein B [Candidatus Peregrinibacteria bacterium]